MPCYYQYRTRKQREQQKDPQEEMQQRRDQAFEKIEQELAAGIARVERDPMTGETCIVGASAMPEGMSDLCVLAGLQTRDSLEWQLAAQKANVQQQNFAVAHNHAHQHGHKH